MSEALPRSPPERVIESCIYATDLEAAERFYSGVLGLELIVREAGRHVFFRCGHGVVLVFNAAETSTAQTFVGAAPIPKHGTRGAGHLAFAVETQQIDEWRARLEAAGVAIESNVVWPKGGESIYVRDPAGNSIELVTPELWLRKAR